MDSDNTAMKINIPDDERGGVVYSGISPSSRGSARMATPHLLMKAKQEIEEIFEMFDENGDGQISVDELKVGLESMDIDVEVKEVINMIEAVDRDGDYYLTMDEFSELLLKWYSDGDSAVGIGEEEGTVEKAKYKAPSELTLTRRQLEQVQKDLSSTKRALQLVNKKVEAPQRPGDFTITKRELENYKKELDKTKKALRMSGTGEQLEKKVAEIRLEAQVASLKEDLEKTRQQAKHGILPQDMKEIRDGDLQTTSKELHDGHAKLNLPYPMSGVTIFLLPVTEKEVKSHGGYPQVSLSKIWGKLDTCSIPIKILQNGFYRICRYQKKLVRKRKAYAQLTTEKNGKGKSLFLHIVDE